MINSNILTFLIAYLFITFSVIGYGLLFERVSTKFNSSKQLGLTGLIGIFFLVLYSYISHYFVSHNILHNTILLIVGFLLFIFL